MRDYLNWSENPGQGWWTNVLYQHFSGWVSQSYWNMLTVLLAGLGRSEGGGVGNRIGKDSLSTLLKALHLFPSQN